MHKATVLRAVLAAIIAVSLAAVTYSMWVRTTDTPTITATQDTQVRATLNYNARGAWPANPGTLTLNTTTYEAASQAAQEGATLYVSTAGDRVSYIQDGNIYTTPLYTGQATQLTEAAPTNPPRSVEYQDAQAAWDSLIEESRSNAPTWGVVAGVLLAAAAALIIAKRRGRATASVTVTSGAGRSSKNPVPDTSFLDVAGADEAVAELAEIVEFLKNPEKFTKVGATPPTGALLVGPPGTGKTLLARAVAGEAGVPFYATSGSDFVEKYVGVGASRVRNVFSKARKAKNGAIVFIDEIDAVGRTRGGANSHSETENTLNALLVEMDGFTATNTIVIAATNRADTLDSALTRPGRLSRQVHVPLPDRAARQAILEVHTRTRPLAQDVDLAAISRRTPGMSGAELEHLVNEASIYAARRDGEEVTAADFEEAVATASMGKARHSAFVTDHDREITAWHEAGHTVAALVHPNADRPASVSIIPRGPAGGVTWTTPSENVFLTKAQAHARLVVAMSGRAAEEVLLNGEFTSGAHGDLAAATHLAYAMVTQYGMGPSGVTAHDPTLFGRGDSGVKGDVDSMLSGALEEARNLIRKHRHNVQALATELLEHDTLSGDRIAVAAQLTKTAAGTVSEEKQ